MSDDEVQRDDRHDWEIINPSEWLRDPYFRTNNPDWIVEVQSAIDKGRADKGEPQKILTTDEIDRLKHIVAEFVWINVFWSGFLNKGDRDHLEYVEKQAEKLLAAIRKLGGKVSKNNGDQPARWYLESELSDSSQKWNLNEIEEILEFLSGFLVKSPQFEEDKTKSTP